MTNDFKVIDDGLEFARGDKEDICFAIIRDRLYISINQGHDSGQDSLNLAEATALRDWLDKCLPPKANP